MSVSELLARQARAWNEGDLAGFCSGYAEHAVYASGGKLVTGRAAIEAMYAGRAGLPRLTLELLDARESGDHAWVLGRYQLDGGQSGSFALVLERDGDGQWAIVLDHTA